MFKLTCLRVKRYVFKPSALIVSVVIMCILWSDEDGDWLVRESHIMF